METKVALSVNGQAVLKSDFNAVAEEGALAVDRAMWELLRTGPGPGAPVKYVLPNGGPPNSYVGRGGGIIVSSGFANAKVTINPFSVVIGSRSALSPSVKDAVRDIRVATFYGDDAVTGLPFGELQLPATTAGYYRFDLIWARVDVDKPDAGVNRYVKNGSGQATSQVIQVTSQTTVTIGRTGGTETNSGLASRPALPADGAGSYYVPLAYVALSSHTLTTQVSGFSIHEVFPPIQPAAQHGLMQMRAPDGAWSLTGPTVVNEGWTANGVPPPSHLPSGFQGGVTLPVPIRMWDASSLGRNVVPGVTVLDRSCDWRKRLFLMTVALFAASGSQGMPWYTGSAQVGDAFQGNQAASGALQLPVFGGNSFNDRIPPSGTAFINSFSGGAVTAGYTLLALTDTSSPALATGAKFALYVDASNGYLCAWRNATDAVREGIIWLQSFTPFRNNDVSST